MKGKYGAEDRYSSKPQMAHLTGEFVIVAKFGGHALRLGLRKWSGREARKQTKNLVLQNPYSSFYNCYIILCTISGFSNVKAVDKGTFCRVICL